MVAKPIQQLLNTAKYHHIDHTKQDVLNTVKYFKTLTPKLERYTFPNGVTKDLVCLDGTIPVVFRDATYNIPVGIFISDNHPVDPPICYVRPTKDMTIKVSRHVDGSGRVYLPYLSDWNRNSCDILSTIQVMQIVFGQSCPVYQKCPGYDIQQSNTPMPPPLPNNPYSIGSNGIPSSSGHNRSPISMPMPSPHSKPSNSGPSDNGTITGHHIRASLLSAVEDRLRSRYKEKVLQIRDEIEVLKRTSEQLNSGRAQLDDLKKRMADELIELIQTKKRMQEMNDQLNEFIIKYDKEEEEIDPDEAYGPTQPLYRQLLDAFAEENAVVDAIYYLCEGLRKGVVTLDVFLKNVRELSRRQFMLRALMHACRSKASLPN